MERSFDTVIIGGGIAGVQAASILCQEQKTAIITDEEYLPYYRMRIEEIISGRGPEELYMHPLSWYEERGIEIIHSRAESIDKEGRAVSLADGSVMHYSSLLLATGSNARIFPLPGRQDRIFTLRRATDAEAIGKALSSAKSFTVIGGGLLGLELASGVADHLHIPVSVIETAEYILPRQLDKPSASLLMEKLMEKGVSVITSASADHADGEYLYLKDGRKIPSSVICFSIGVNPGKEIAEKAGIKTNKGIIVDEYLRTSSSDIYAAGDAAELDGRLFGLAMHAREMGSAAAFYILGKGKPYIPSEPSALLKIGGIDVVSLGRIGGESDVITDDGDRRVTIFTDDGIVTGAILINDKASMARIKALIGSRR